MRKWKGYRWIDGREVLREGGQRRGLLSSEGPKGIRCATQVGRSVPSLFLSASMHKSPLCIFSPLRPLPVLPGLIRLGLQRRRRANVTLARLALFFMLFFKSTSSRPSLARSLALRAQRKLVRRVCRAPFKIESRKVRPLPPRRKRFRARII